MKSQKIKQRMPVVLFGQEYWTQVLHTEVFQEFALIDGDVQSQVYMCDTAAAAFEHLKKCWAAQEALAPSPKLQPAAKRMRLSTEDLPSEPPPRPLPAKAYKNAEFIGSTHSRIFRIQCEFEYTRHRLEAFGIDHTIWFSGSDSWMEEGQATQPSPQRQAVTKARVACRDLARRLTEWSMQRRADGKPSFHVASGGGPGMACANEGAWEAGGKSLALNNAKTETNRYVTPELAFSFHYLFVRKFFMAYQCMGLVALPGGFGTCDEVFELLTLMQTGKMKQKIPIVFIGADFWKRAIDWNKMAEYGMVSDDDISQLLFTDSVEEAYQHITSFLGRSGFPAKKLAKWHSI
jgi:uncharacterized protein (TIGR00730 family)